MATATPGTTHTGSMKAFEDKIRAQIDQAKASLQQFEAKAKEKGSDAETSAIAKLKTAKQDIDRKLQDLKTTHEGHVARAKSDIEADAEKFKASVEGLAAKFKPGKK
jgi:F0F1-type ATP synthase membrane subunit b/b'